LEGLTSWTKAVEGASEILCASLQVASIVDIDKRSVEDALAQSVFDCVKRSPHHIWVPENISESQCSTILLYLTSNSVGFGQED